VDVFRTVTLPLLKRFGVGSDEAGIEFKIVKRGAPPEGGGEVYLKCPIVKELKPLAMTDEGKIKRIRGVVYTSRISPQIANRVVESTRGILNHYIPDVYIHTDPYKGKDAGLSPGFALSLVSESTTGVLISAQRTAATSQLPEDIGKQTANLLCEEIANGGCVDTCHQYLALLLMALCPEDISRVRLGKLSPFTIKFLRLLKDFFGIVFKLKPDPQNSTVVASCLGLGYKNIARRAI